MVEKIIYLPRLIEHEISKSMLTNGCVVIEGPKWSGKSTTAARFSGSIISLQKPAVYEQYKILADIGDDNLLNTKKPVLFDEWQKIPELWDYIRAYIDEHSSKGDFILTGSAKPLKDVNRHSGIGRIKKITMRTMSLWESNESSGQVSLQRLFDGETKISGNNRYTLKDISFLLCRGGFPNAVLEKHKENALYYAKDYVKTLVSSDVVDVDGVRRSEKRAKAILKSYARNISTTANNETILRDVEPHVDIKDRKTIPTYLEAYSKLFVIDETESWTPSLRSKTSIRVSNTRHFVDPCIATAVLDANPDDLLSDLKTFGLLFENLVLRDLKIYTQALDGNVYKYRDKSGLEADAVIHLDDGRWALIEVKLGGENLINEGAQNLLKLHDKIDTDKMKTPSFLAVITASDKFAYQRPDGVCVIPITCLKP